MNAIGVVAGITVAGSSAAVAPVVGGITNVGDVQAGPKPLISSIEPKSALAGTTGVSMIVTGANFTGSTFAFAPASGIDITKTTISSDGTTAALVFDISGTAIGTLALVASSAAGNSGTAVTQANRFTAVDSNSIEDTDSDGFQDVIEAVFGTDPLDPTSFPSIAAATEAESVAFSVLNAPITDAGITEAESLAFSVLNAPITGAGITQAVSGAFSVLNAPINAAGIVESESYFSVRNNFGTAKSATAQAQSNQNAENRLSTIRPPVLPRAIDPFLDSDGDGLPDWLELLIGTDPYNPETDGDGLSDFEEVFIYHTNPLLADTDGDGFADGAAILFGSDP